MKKRCQGKTHFIHPTALVDDYPNSPHISNGIKNKEWAFCNYGTIKITDDKSKVNCKGCLKLIMEADEC